MPIKAYKKSITKTSTKSAKTNNGWNKNWIAQFNNHISTNATNFGWTKAQVNAFCQAFSAWEKAFNCFQNGSTVSTKPVKKSTPKSKTSSTKRVTKTVTAPKAIRTKTNFKRNSSTRNYKVAA